MTVDVIVLRKRLAEAEQALHELLVGKSVVSISRSDSSAGSRSMDYTQANINDLKAYIISIKTKLRVKSGRLPPAGVYR